MSWTNEVLGKDEKGQLKLFSADLCIEYVNGKPSDPSISIGLEIDPRLITPENNPDNIIEFKKSDMRKRKHCKTVQREIQLYSPKICDDASPFYLMVKSVNQPKSTQSEFGIDIGCMNDLPKVEIDLPKALGQARVELSVEQTVNEVQAIVTPETVATEYKIKVKVTDDKHIRNPFLLIDYDPNEAELDASNTQLQGWEDISCPSPQLKCSDYDSDMNSVRKCVRKPLGGSISAEEGLIEEKIVMNVRATGKEKYISLNAQIQSCGMCNKVKLACENDFELSNGKCSSTILATAGALILEPL